MKSISLKRRNKTNRLRNLLKLEQEKNLKLKFCHTFFLNFLQITENRKIVLKLFFTFEKSRKTT